MKDPHNANFASLTIDIRPSYPLALLFIIFAFLVLLCLIYLPASTPIKSVLAVLIVSMIAYEIRLHALLNMAASIQQLGLSAKGEWYIKRMNGTVEPVLFDASSFVASYGAVINLNMRHQKGSRLLSGHHRSVLLVPSRVDAQAFRRLRIILRWAKPETLTNA